MELKELIERVKAATGPDSDLDSNIGFALGWYAQGYNFYAWVEADGTFIESVNPKPFTASIDAALALVERCLPGSGYVIGMGRETPDEPLGACAIYSGLSGDSRELAEEEAHTLPLAIILALLTALDQKEENK